MLKTYFIIIFCSVCITCVIAQEQFLAMEVIPSNWKAENSSLSISKKHYKIGNTSLEWTYKKGGKLIIETPCFLEQAIHINRSGPQFWIYNETPIKDSLKVSFISEKGIEKYYYFKLNFKGWRANAVPFFTMKGNTQWQSTPCEMVIEAPKNRKGILYIDRFRFTPKPFNIRMTNDAQQDFVDTQTIRSHWTGMWYWNQKYTLPVAPKSITQEQENELKTIIGRINNYTKSKLLKSINTKRTQEIQDNFFKFNIQRDKEGNITGKVFVCNDEYYPQQGDANLQDFGKMLLQLVSLWKLTNDPNYKSQIYDVLDQMIDQGYDVGSGCGTNHHFGYTYREMLPVFWAMREDIIVDNKSDKYFPIYVYWSGLAETRKILDITEVEGIPDFWNTILMHRLAACFMTKSKEEQWRNLDMLKNYVNTTLQISPGVWTGIKKDGSIFHHGGLYPAYACDGLSGLSVYINIVKNTSLMPDSMSLENLKKTLLAIGQYTAYDEWGFGICGRHPLGSTFNKGVVNLVGNLALYKNYPNIDTSLAGLYLRWGKNDADNKFFLQKKGFKPDSIYNQFTVMNHGALGILRGGNWQVLLKGYNRFVWGSEIYEKANRYGRYQSYGTIQIVGNGNPVNLKESGYVQEGWNWNHYPGATNIVLPLDSLECVDTFVMMDKSHSRFAGASHLNHKNGIFAISIQESNFPRFTPSFRAKKSVFAFDSVLIYLGSNITDNNQNYPTQTTLFQIHETPVWYAEENSMQIDTKKNGVQNIKDKNKVWISDIQGNVYYFPKISDFTYSFQNQISKHNQNKKTTESIFKTAYINHGFAPKNEAYEYAVLVKGANNKASFLKAMNNEKLYRVIEKNEKNHILYYYPNKITGFVFFEENNMVKDSLLKSVNMASLVMIQPLNENKSLYTISVCQPDLNLNKDTTIPVEFHGPAEYSTPQRVILTLAQNWLLENAPQECRILNNDENTMIEIVCQDGEPVQFNIRKKEKNKEI